MLYFNIFFLGLGATILGLQATSFAIIVSTTLACIGFICCSRNDDDDDDDVGCCAMLGGCMLCLYPVAGKIMFSVSNCDVSCYLNCYNNIRTLHYFVSLEFCTSLIIDTFSSSRSLRSLKSSYQSL